MSAAAAPTGAAIAAARAYNAAAVAKSALPLGVYMHYKQQLYQVHGTVRHTETEEELVLYRACYNSPTNPDNTLWVRPLTMFKETVEYEGKTVPRFTLVDPDEKQ